MVVEVVGDLMVEPVVGMGLDMVLGEHFAALAEVTVCECGK